MRAELLSRIQRADDAEIIRIIIIGLVALAITSLAGNARSEVVHPEACAVLQASAARTANNFMSTREWILNPEGIWFPGGKGLGATLSYKTLERNGGRRWKV